MKDMNKDGNKKILLDLRDVSAGDMPEAVRLTNFFVNTGTIATLEGQKFPKQIFSADPSKAINTTAPLVVLVNHGTSGPAELVAGALQDSGRAQLVGEKTFGEGSMQKTFDLPDGGAIILSIAKYASPSGKQFEDDAVTPATVVASNKELFEDDDSADATAPLRSRPTRRHLQGIRLPRRPRRPTDDQFNKALDLLKAKAA